MLLWSDNPDGVDLLGFKSVAACIADIVTEATLSPVTVGIEGDWGSGKSSMLGFVEETLQNNSAVVTVRTSPWEYDPNIDTQAVLITTILNELRDHAKSGAYSERAQANLKKLIQRVDMIKVLRLGLKSVTTWTIPDSGSLVDALSGKKTDSLTLEGFRKEFARLIEDLSDVSRVVVLVDDLDRCLPGTVVSILETVKLFLSVDKMAFVIAADRRVVGNAIATHYKPSRHAQELGLQYIEKISQVTIPVPKLLRQRDTEVYLSLLILRYYCTGDELDRLVSRCRAIGRSSDRELVSLADLEELTSRFGTSVGGHLSIASILAQQIYIPLEGNPRRVKRFLNALFLRERALIAQETPFALVFIAYWMVLEVCHPHQFEVLVSLFHDIDADADEMLRLLQECKTSGVLPGQQNDDSLVIQAWLEMVPARMVEETILPYLPVAASLRRTQPTISGPSRGPSRVADPSRGPSRVADPFDPPAPRPPSHPPLIDRGHSMEPPRPAAAGPHDNKPSIDGRPPGTAPVPPLDPKPFPPDARSSTPPSLS
jgi:hypothetical protein